MISLEEKNKRYKELLKYSDKSYDDFLTDWEYLCENASPQLAGFMKTAMAECTKEVIKMKDVVKINGKSLSYYLEDVEPTFYEEGKAFSTTFLCIWHIANSCVYKRANGLLSDGFHVQYRIDNADRCAYITLAIISCLLYHTLSGASTTVDVTFDNVLSATTVMRSIQTILSFDDFKDVTKLTVNYQHTFKR